MASNNTGRDAARSGVPGKTKAVSGGGKRTGKGKGTTREKEPAPRLRTPSASDEDGRWRIPAAYNVQFASDTQSGAVAGVAVDNNGSDMGKMAPMNEALAADYGERPRQHLADGGYAKFDDIEALENAGVEVYAPVPAPRDKNRDRYAPQPDDAPAIAAWRSAWAPKRQKTSIRSGRRRLNALTRKREIVACGSFSCTVSAKSNRSRSAWPDTQHGVRLASHCGLILNSARKGARAPGINRRSGDRPA